MMNAPAVSSQKVKEDLIIEQLKIQYKGAKNLWERLHLTLYLVLSQGVANNLSFKNAHS